MARRYGEPISVQMQDGRPVQFRWRGVIYRVRVIGTWRLATRWWERETVAAGAAGAAGAGKEAGKGAVDRVYFRVQTADQQVFELYYEIADGAQHQGWVLDVCLD